MTLFQLHSIASDGRMWMSWKGSSVKCP